MTINTKELLDAVAILADEREMKVTLKSSAKGALICGGSAFVGAILMGPVGLAVGGTVGGVTAAYMSRGTICVTGLHLCSFVYLIILNSR